MKHLKKSFFLSLILLTSIIGSWTFASNLFTSDANVSQEVVQDVVPVGAGSNPTTPNPAGSEATNIILQSTDGGQTWQDISYSLPGNEQPEGFYAGESELYLQVKNEMYHSTSNLKAPVWEKASAPDQKSKTATGWPLIAFNRSGVMAYNYQGEIFQKTPAADPDPDPDSYRDYRDYRDYQMNFYSAIIDILTSSLHQLMLHFHQDVLKGTRY
jgi:hypothetical protein